MQFPANPNTNNLPEMASIYPPSFEFQQIQKERCDKFQERGRPLLAGCSGNPTDQEKKN